VRRFILKMIINQFIKGYLEYPWVVVLFLGNFLLPVLVPIYNFVLKVMDL
jgi:hypothetical protein